MNYIEYYLYGWLWHNIGYWTVAIIPFAWFLFGFIKAVVRRLCDLGDS